MGFDPRLCAFVSLWFNYVMLAFECGQSVRFSEKGKERVRSMPEAWGLHRALYGEEKGEVVDFSPAEDDLPAQASVEFPSGGAYNWDADCFEPVSD